MGYYALIDITMTFYVLIYILSVLKAVGVFNAIKRWVTSLRYAYNDKVVNYLMKKIDERQFGLENMHTGMVLVQQWDDVIRSQRRYALLLWPDVRPLTTNSCLDKIIYIKGASLFNLTLSNLKTSLGLTILHTAMCQSDVAAARYLIHNYPELLFAEDSQRDTPMSIALKECAFYLILYSTKNNGCLDDGTSFADDDFPTYYPEAVEMRDMVEQYGEFLPELTEIYDYSAQDIESVNENYLLVDKPYNYVDPNVNHHAMQTEFISDKDGPSKYAQLKLAKKKLIDVRIPNEPTYKKLPKYARKENEKRMELLKKNPNYIQRFPEDVLHDEFEAGQAMSWGIVGLQVPEHTIDNDFYGGTFIYCIRIEINHCVICFSIITVLLCIFYCQLSP